MRVREQYRGYVLEADPRRRGGRWTAGVVIELHQRGAVHYQPVADDPFVTYETRDEAERASIRFGKRMVDSQLASR